MSFTKNICLFIIAFFCFELSAQQTAYERSTNLAFIKNGNQLELALCGGFNNPQFNEADLNQDGFMDLVIFDRNDDKIMTFLNKGIPSEIGYTYAPEYESMFPEMKGYLLMRDFNCDGIADIFTPRTYDVAYYEGSFNNDGNLIFTEISNQLTFFGEENLPIEIADTDYPEVRDIDDDGLMDILTFNEEIGGTVNFFKNVSDNCGGLDFIKADTCWGDFYESGNAATIEINNCGTGKSPTHEVHPGSTLLTLDTDNDGIMELITGDINSNALTLLKNGGSKDDALIVDFDYNFPSYNFPVNVSQFPASFYIDVNNDGKKDLLASPNSKNASETLRSSWLYLDISDNDVPNFFYVNDQFLNEESLDYGTRSMPAFADINADGLIDMVVGNYGSREFGNEIPTSSLSYYENIGTADSAVFELKTNDWAGISGLFSQGLHPTFGDLDGDGAIDMICGMNGEVFPSGQDLDGKLYFFKNAAPAGMPFELSLPILLSDQTGETIDVGQSSAPQLVDVNEDGLLDLVVGEFRGKINYLKNIGTVSNYEFEWISDIWGNFDVKDPEGTGKGYSVPKLVKLDNDENWSLIVGSFDGRLYRFTDIEENAENGGSFTLVDNYWCNIDDTEHSAPAFADLNNNGDLELVSGCKRGGLLYYTPFIDSTETSITSALINQQNLSFYPNPANNFIQFYDTNIEVVSIYNAKGQLIEYKSIMNENQLNIQHLNSGLYFIETTFLNGEKRMEKLVKL